jgi:GT2 family glycosyltransferase
MAEQRRVAIVIVNYNGFEYTRECLDSIEKLTYPDYVILLVDNGSADGSGEALRTRYQDRIVYVPLAKNLGVTGGNNAGIRYALTHACDYVLFLNNDTLVEADLLDKLVQASQANDDAMVVPKIICYYDQKRLDHWIGSAFNWRTGRPDGFRLYPYDEPALNVSGDIAVASTCCLLAPIAVVRSVGGMDENYFMYYDDADFTLRVARAGYRLRYEAGAIIYHKCNLTTSQQQPAYFEYYLIGRNFFYFYNKLCDRPALKYFFLIRNALALMWNFVKSYREHNSAKRQVIRLIIKDVLAKRMGPPPPLPRGAQARKTPEPIGV